MKKKDKIKIASAIISCVLILSAFIFFGRESIIGKAIVIAAFIMWLVIMAYANKYFKN